MCNGRQKAQNTTARRHNNSSQAELQSSRLGKLKLKAHLVLEAISLHPHPSTPFLKNQKKRVECRRETEFPKIVTKGESVQLANKMLQCLSAMNTWDSTKSVNEKRRKSNRLYVS